MKKKSPWVTLILFVVIVVGVSLCFMQFTDYRAEKELLQQEEQLLQTSEQRLTALQALHKNKGQLEADIEVLAQLMPGAAEEDQLLLDLQSGADLASMDFSQIRFAERIEGQGYVEMPIQMHFNGTYHELLFFLDYLQVYERAIRINEMRVDEGQEEGTKSVNISASTFFIRE